MARVLWKQINATDFNAMLGSAARSNTGGGARHIVLGTSTRSNDVAAFLPTGHGNEVKVPTEAGPVWPRSTLTFRSNPKRRKGEWVIADQKEQRHPAWATAAGFPTSLSRSNPPIVLVFEIGGTYHVAWLDKSTATSLVPEIGNRNRGVLNAPPILLAKLGFHQKSALREFSETKATAPSAAFDPINQEDARKRIYAEIVRRQGQGQFRKKVSGSCNGVCVVTGCAVAWVLEAAHISPYRGPNTNKADNGLLLRADIHTLFDLGLLSIHPDTLKIRVAKQIAEPGYRALDGRTLLAVKIRPSKAALREHWSRSTA